MAKEIPESRRTAYYVGTALMVAGILLFASTFVSACTHFGDFRDFDGQAKSGMFRAFAGIALVLVGGIVRGIGARGLAGSGVVLDPKRAREDLEPYSRMAGGMVRDALDEAGAGTNAPQRIVALKCPACARLNEEDSKFCQECGARL